MPDTKGDVLSPHLRDSNSKRTDWLRGTREVAATLGAGTGQKGDAGTPQGGEAGTRAQVSAARVYTTVMTRQRGHRVCALGACKQYSHKNVLKSERLKILVKISRLCYICLLLVLILPKGGIDPMMLDLCERSHRCHHRHPFPGY